MQTRQYRLMEKIRNRVNMILEVGKFKKPSNKDHFQKTGKDNPKIIYKMINNIKDQQSGARGEHQADQTGDEAVEDNGFFSGTDKICP
jgi:hypothetical protein